MDDDYDKPTPLFSTDPNGNSFISGNLHNVLYVVAGVCLLVLIISILWFVILCKLGKFSDNPKYKRRRYMQSKYQSMADCEKFTDSFNLHSRRYSEPRKQRNGPPLFTHWEENEIVLEPTQNLFSKKKKRQIHESPFSSRTPALNLLYPVSSDMSDGGSSNHLNLSDELGSPSDSYYTAHSVYLTPTQPGNIINGDIFFRPCREKLEICPDFVVEPYKVELAKPQSQFLPQSAPRKQNFKPWTFWCCFDLVDGLLYCLRRFFTPWILLPSFIQIFRCTFENGALCCCS